MQAQGPTNSQMYILAKSLAEGKSDPVPTTPSGSFQHFGCLKLKQLVA